MVPVTADDFESFYWEQLPRLRRFLTRRISSKETREDLETTIMTLAWRRLPDRPVDDRTFGWLAGIAGGVVANERRAERRRGALLERVVGHRGTAGAADVPQAPDQVDGGDPAVAAALATLGDDDREILLLHEWDGCSYAEIAAATGINEAAARKRLSRARARFADAWSAAQEQDGGGHGA